MEYRVEVIELHEVRKTYIISADNKKDARSMAKDGKWDDASGDEFTGTIRNVEVKAIYTN